MSLLDDLCRICSDKLDRSVSANIFAPNHSSLLSIIVRCIPVPVSKDDCYPKYVCIHCVFKLNVFYEMHDKSLSSVKVFNEILAVEQGKTVEPDESVSFDVKQESYELELTEDPDLKVFSEEMKHTPHSTYAEHSYARNTSKLTCDFCRAGFTKKISLLKHISWHIRPFKCEHCDTRFVKKDSLTRHEKTHLGEKRYKCKNCDKVFEDSTIFSLHRTNAHAKKKRYDCKICFKKFWTSFQLTNHSRVHSGEKPFQCSDCNKRFSEKSNLIVHRRWHTGEKRHKCEKCERTYTRLVDLAIHKRIHTKERPYQCPECGKDFSDPSAFYRHKRVVHAGEKPFQCQLCEKSFSRPAHLTLHNRTHTGEKPFHCENCDKKYADPSSLRVHKRRHGIREMNKKRLKTE